MRRFQKLRCAFHLLTLIAVGLPLLGCGSSSTAESFLVLVTSNSATADGSNLTMQGADLTALMFSDIPYRDVKTVSLSDLALNWARNFELDPNAVLTWNSGDESASIVIELQQPTFEDSTITFPYIILSDEQVFNDNTNFETSIPTEIQDVRLFVDSVQSQPVYEEYCTITSIHLWKFTAVYEGVGAVYDCDLMTDLVERAFSYVIVDPDDDPENENTYAEITWVTPIVGGDGATFNCQGSSKTDSADEADVVCYPDNADDPNDNNASGEFYLDIVFYGND